MFQIMTPKGTIAMASAAGIVERRPNVIVHLKSREGQTWCLCCKNRADVWTDSKYYHKRHAMRCQPIGHWPKGEEV